MTGLYRCGIASLVVRGVGPFSHYYASTVLRSVSFPLSTIASTGVDHLVSWGMIPNFHLSLGPLLRIYLRSSSHIVYHRKDRGGLILRSIRGCLERWSENVIACQRAVQLTVQYGLRHRKKGSIFAPFGLVTISATL